MEQGSIKIVILSAAKNLLLQSKSYCAVEILRLRCAPAQNDSAASADYMSSKWFFYKLRVHAEEIA